MCLCFFLVFIQCSSVTCRGDSGYLGQIRGNMTQFMAQWRTLYIQYKYVIILCQFNFSTWPENTDVKKHFKVFMSFPKLSYFVTRVVVYLESQIKDNFLKEADFLLLIL